MVKLKLIETGRRIMDDDLNSIITFLGVAVCILLLVFIWAIPTSSVGPSQNTIQVQNNQLAKLKANDYITVDQSNTLFNKAKSNDNTKLMDKMDNLHVVDNSDGFSYLFDVYTKDEHRFLHTDTKYYYKLVPIKNGGKAVINKSWQKEHK